MRIDGQTEATDEDISAEEVRGGLQYGSKLPGRM